ncbi:hypothetical protein DUNSADRAFT_18746 [Dunaliella salina]|uniref:Uncharacterized protein n=1 Tax=Dunaliella salina TaxID=3046 RepID=A0ABQ7GYR1_DUNSA|nr:hypothetical protein DUNSADRAFT_18746 [Dunaliella salina]|eukprot:KAF5839744.1 hypothetical protein DUNSADRAFT_18746 [Dunaliella salina]
MGQNLIEHRPAMVWLTELQKAKAEGGTTTKPKITVQDLLERINDPNAPEQALIPTSPRSVQACFRLGVDPVDLQFHPVHWYKQKEDADEEVTRLRYERYEAVRQERLRLLIEERKHLINENWQANTDPRAMLRRNDSGADPRSSSAMVEKERQRLEVLKRRQEKELQQMVQYEITRKELLDKQQKRVEEQERRAMEQAQLKIQHEAARMAKQREIELQRMAEEKEMERRARVLAEETYRSYRTKLSKTWLIHAREEAHKKEEEHRKHLERLDKYAAALETEEMCKLSVKERAAEKERLLAELNARRKKENDLKKVDSDFQLKLRLDKVDCIQKMSLYNRQQLLERIMHDYDKTRELLKERQDLQTQRKMANMNASLQRQMMSKAMDSLRFTKNVGSLSSGGSVNINDLLSRTRPSTAL